MRARVFFLLILILSGLVLGRAQQQLEDVVYMKNGTVVRGTIVEQVPGKSLKIQTKDGNVFVFMLDDIQRTTKEHPVGGPPMVPQAVTPGMNSFALRGSLGTDIELGLGFGGGVNYIWQSSLGGTAFELGGDIFLHNSEGHETDGEDTRWSLNLLVFSIRANGLFNYNHRQSGVYFIAGIGFVIASMDYKETYGGRYSYWEPYDLEVVTPGNVVNLGIGFTTGSGLEVRLETPMLFFYSSEGASSFVPTATVGVQFRLN